MLQWRHDGINTKDICSDEDKNNKDSGYSDVDNDGHDNTVVAGMMIMTMILIMMMVMMIMIVTMKGKVIENRWRHWMIMMA